MAECPAGDRCSAPVDITIMSSDEEEFGAHRQHLSLFCDGFAAVEFAPNNGPDEVVTLIERSNVVSVLLRFMHPRPPDVAAIPSEEWPEIAEAVEKYQVLSAIDLCRLKMRELIPESTSFALDVLVYAFKHDFADLIGLAGPRTLEAELKLALEKMGNGPLFLAWLRVREERRGISRQILCNPPGGVLHPGGALHCDMWYRFRVALLETLSDNIITVSNFQEAIDSEKNYTLTCKHCTIKANQWLDTVKRKLEKWVFKI